MFCSGLLTYYQFIKVREKFRYGNQSLTWGAGGDRIARRGGAASLDSCYGYAPDCDDHFWGWTSAFDKLGEQLLVMQTAGLLNDLMWKERRRDGVAEDFAEAARRAEAERQTMPADQTVPPSARG